MTEYSSHDDLTRFTANAATVELFALVFGLGLKATNFGFNFGLEAHGLGLDLAIRCLGLGLGLATQGLDIGIELEI